MSTQWCGVDKVAFTSLYLTQYPAESRPQHVISYYISPTILNILLFYTVPNSLGKPLEGPSVTYAEQEEIMELYKDWEPDLRAVTGVCAPAHSSNLAANRGVSICPSR